MTLIAQNQRPPWFSIALISLSALAYEILLMRLFSIIQWHHFAYMIISLALLGYGASGTFLSLARHYLLPRYSLAYLINLVMFGFSSLLCYLISQQIQFNAEEILWDIRHGLRLMAIYLLLSLPFFFVANAIGLSFMRYHKDVARIYAADLLGAGAGSALVIALLFMAFPAVILKYIFMLVMFAAVLASWELFRHQSRKLIVMMCVFFLMMSLSFFMPKSSTQLELSPYKGLSQTLRIPGANILSTSSSPLGLITLVENPLIPFRHAPGLSLNAGGEPPEQLGIFIDGDAMTVLTHYSGDRKPLEYIDQLTSALPYHLVPVNNALILGAGGGAQVLQAKYHGVKQVSAVELDKKIIDIVKTDYKKFSGNIYNDNNVTLYSDEARAFFIGNKNLYDLIQLSFTGSVSASSAGLHALSEDYIYTVEALREYYKHLSPDGYLAITRWIKLPPRDTLKLFATAVTVLRQQNIKQPGQHLILIRGLQTSTLLVKKSPISMAEIDSLKRFVKHRAFDMAYYPGMQLEQANSYNVLSEPVFFTAAKSLLSKDRNNYIQRYKFNIEPATDDRPYFFNYFKWKVFPEILSLKGKGGVSLLDAGYLILVATLLQALLLSFIIIILPLICLKKTQKITRNKTLNIPVFVYFFSLGLAFLLIEIAFIQKFILFLQLPVYAIAVVLAAFLIFAGLGSLWSNRFINSGKHHTGLKISVLLILFIGAAYILSISSFISYMITLPVILKVIISILIIAPLAFFMGMPFPLGLSKLSELNSDLVPWVWGVNGCASVISAVLASLLAIHLGFSFVIMSALVLYVLASLSSAGWFRRAS